MSTPTASCYDIQQAQGVASWCGAAKHHACQACLLQRQGNLAAWMSMSQPACSSMLIPHLTKLMLLRHGSMVAVMFGQKR